MSISAVGFLRFDGFRSGRSLEYFSFSTKDFQNHPAAAMDHNNQRADVITYCPCSRHYAMYINCLLNAINFNVHPMPGRPFRTEILRTLSDNKASTTLTTYIPSGGHLAM